MKTRVQIAAAVMMLAIICGCVEKKQVENRPAFATELDKISYALGSQVGRSFKQGGIEINDEFFVWGLKDVLSDSQAALSDEEMQNVMTAFQQRMRMQQQERMMAEGAKNIAEGAAFLEANKTKEGIKVLPSGLQYKVLQEGAGRSPDANDRVKTHYRGRLIDGTEFDSSYKRNQPAEFAVNGVIKGWTEALQLMNEGSRWELYVPAELAYGQRGSGRIPPNSVLIFEVELLEVLK
ncbi:MAG: FKBP-type peptidyl-prolyl cis-trans isomerase [Planctomycetota bacterium]